MRNFFRKVAAALARLRASVSEVVLTCVRAAEGAVSWVWEAVTRSGVTAPVDYEPAGYDMPEPQAPATDQETLDAGLRLVGEQVVRAATEMLRHGEITSGDISIDVAGWVRSLNKDDLRVLAEADTLAAGRHVAGMEPLLCIVGQPISRPHPKGDADRLAKRRRMQEERQADERAQVAAARQRLEQKRELEWLAEPDAPALVPSY